MPRRIEQLNEQLKEELANLIAKEIPLENGLITVCFVNCSSDLKHAKVAISVLPDKFAGTALAGLRKHSSSFSRSLREKLRIRQIPRFHWTLDTTESKAAEIEEVIKQINEEKLN